MLLLLPGIKFFILFSKKNCTVQILFVSLPGNYIIMRKLLTILLLIFAVTFHAEAAYLENVPQIITQPNGDTIHCFASGDEFFNRLHDENGFTIIQAPDGWYYYATETKGEIVASRYKVRSVDPAKRGLRPHVKISQEDYFSRREARNSLLSPKSSRIPNTKGVIDGITIYIRFNDDSEFTQTEITRIRDNFSGSSNSVRDYFQKVSYNQLDIRTTHIPANTGAVITSFVASHPRNHYRPHNAATNPDGYRNDNERAHREWQLLRDAIDWVRTNNLLPAGLTIDNNGDGYADMVNFVVKGNSEGWNNLLWAHKWALQTVGGINYETVISGSIKVREYTFLPENQTSVRTLAHEVYHVLGAPDLYRYDTVHNHIDPAGRWDLMETGSGHMLAHMKIKYGGWVSSDIPEITQAGTYTLLSQGKNSTRNVFKIPGNAQEYFLLEYRQRTDDNFEMNLPGSGLIVTRINSTMTGSADFNGTTIFDEVYVLRPGGSVTSNGAITNANLSNRVGRMELSKDHATSPFFSNGSVANFLIYDIIDFGDSIRFSFSPRFVPDPRNFSGRWRGDSIVLHWSPNDSHQNVMLIYDTIPISDLPEFGIVYQNGDVFPSGATVLYTGNDSLFVHTPIKSQRTYYYRLFTKGDLSYSIGADAVVKTAIEPQSVENLNNFLPIDTLITVYTFQNNGGYATGHNVFGNWKFAERFKNNKTGRVQSLFFDVARIQNNSGNGHIFISVWDVDHTGLPGRELTRDSVSYRQLRLRGNEHFFKTPPLVQSDFFVGISICYERPVDTIVFFTTLINPLRDVTGFVYTGNYTWNTFANLNSANIGMAYSVRLNIGGLFLTSLPQRLTAPAAGAQGLIVDVFSTLPWGYDVVSNDDWIYVSVDRNLDRIFVDVDPSDVDRVGEILIIAEGDTNRVFVYQGSWASVQKSEELAVILFPNPSTDGIFYLQSDGGEMQLDVFDMMGRNLWSRRTFSQSEKIDLSRQRNGMYILRIIKNGQQKTFRLIKQ